MSTKIITITPRGRYENAQFNNYLNIFRQISSKANYIVYSLRYVILPKSRVRIQ